MHKNSRNRLPDGWRDSYDNGWGQSGYKNPDLNPQNSEPQDYGFSANTSTNNGYYDGYTNDLSNQNSGYTNQYMNDYSNSFEENPYSNPYESGYQPNFEAGYTQNYGESDMNNSGSLMPVSLYGGYEQPEQRFTDYTQEYESGFYQSNAKPKYKKIALGALCAVLAAGVFIGGDLLSIILACLLKMLLLFRFVNHRFHIIKGLVLPSMLDPMEKRLKY